MSITTLQIAKCKTCCHKLEGERWCEKSQDKPKRVKELCEFHARKPQEKAKYLYKGKYEYPYNKLDKREIQVGDIFYYKKAITRVRSANINGYNWIEGKREPVPWWELYPVKAYRDFEFDEEEWRQEIAEGEDVPPCYYFKYTADTNEVSFGVSTGTIWVRDSELIRLRAKFEYVHQIQNFLRAVGEYERADEALEILTWPKQRQTIMPRETPKPQDEKEEGNGEIEVHEI